MMQTLYSQGLLESSTSFLVSLGIGILFGFALERGGLGSARRVTGLFYFRDMVVLKVMFSALIVGMLCINYAKSLGWLNPDSLYYLPSIYPAQFLGGLLFGVGFAMGGWCPGTAAVGMATGRLDALIFLFGSILGSVTFNEVYPWIAPLTQNSQGTQFAYEAMHLSEATLVFLFTLLAIALFWGSERIEAHYQKTLFTRSRFLKRFSILLFCAAAGLLIFPQKKSVVHAIGYEISLEQQLAQELQKNTDHIDPEQVADLILSAQPMQLIDLRSPAEYRAFHIRTAINVQPVDLRDYLYSTPRDTLIVLYSNGMTHPAQLRDSLFRQGFSNVKILTDGLEGFKANCLKPLSLRTTPTPPEKAHRIERCRLFFLSNLGDTP